MGMLSALACASSNDERNFETCRRWHKQAVAGEKISKFGYSCPTSKEDGRTYLPALGY
jgi:hypothetical protein